MKCLECKLGEICNKQCVPKGQSEDVNIYFLGEAPGPMEDDFGEVFIGPEGKYLFNLIEPFGLNINNCRFNNIVRCIPKDSKESHFRVPNKDELNACMHYFLEDIEETKPKVIVTLGNTPTKTLFPELSGSITQIRGKILDYNGTIVVPTFHPSYLMRQSDNNKIRLDFKSDIKLAIELCLNPEKVKEKNRSQGAKDNDSSTVVCLDFKSFNDFCSEKIEGREEVAYDVETNAMEVHSADHKVVGFSLASDKDSGCYVPIVSLDYQMDDTNKRLIEKKMKKILPSKDVIVYNCQHEYPATLNWLGIEMPKVDDIFVMVKLMMGNADQYAGNGGLKAQSVLNLKYKDWSADLDKYFSYLIDFINKKDEMKELISEYYSGDELENVMNLIEDVYFNKLPSKPTGTISYEYVPYKLIGRYGSIDSSVLFELKDFYDKWMREEGEKLGIDLFRGYRYWMMHHYCGYTLEKNGAYWNDERAQKVEDWCNDGMHDSLRELITSPLSEPYLRNKIYNEFLIYLKDNYLTEMIGPDFTPKRLYKTSVDVICNNENGREKLSRMSLLSNKNKAGEDTGVYKLQLGNIETLGKRYLFDHPDLFDNWYHKYMENYSKEDHTINDYKKILNPNATSSDYREFVSNLLLTPEIRYAKLYSSLRVITESPGYSIEQFPVEDDHRLMILVDKLRVSDMTPSQRFDMFMKFMNKDRQFGPRIRREITNALSFQLSSLDAETMNEVYDLYLMCHIDVEDNTTWNEHFKWLFNYKMFKKFSKLISTYINGKVGRNNVYLVDKESYTNGDYFTKRDALYNKDTNDKYKGSKVMMLQQDFRVNMADTGRWQSGIHNLPAGEAIKSIYTSRFPGGCIGMPDGSQMEVRTLAAECRDENLLKAFKDGVDIHRFFASKIYRVPYEEVQDWQRGLAKNAVFGMIYGESEKAFADIYLKGDLTQAKQIFDDMFTGFPKIKEYIERAQSQYEKFGKVTTITQRYLNLNDPRIDHNTMLRRSQNYPIQAAAEDLAGIIMYKLCEYLKENNMKSKPFCFIHDSIEIDMHPDEVFMIADKVNYLFNVFPLEEFGVPVACDFPMGPSMGQECEVVEMLHDDNYNDVTITLKGFVDDIEELVEIWRTVYSVVDYIDKEDYESKDKESYVPFSKAFLPKKAQISMMMGSTRYKGSRKIHVIRKV